MPREVPMKRVASAVILLSLVIMLTLPAFAQSEDRLTLPEPVFKVVKAVFIDWSDLTPENRLLGTRFLFGLLIFILYFAALRQLKDKLHLTQGIMISLTLVLSAFTVFAIPSSMMTQFTGTFAAIFWSVVMLAGFMLLNYLIFHTFKEQTFGNMMVKMALAGLGFAFFDMMNQLIKAGGSVPFADTTKLSPMFETLSGIAYWVQALFVFIFGYVIISFLLMKTSGTVWGARHGLGGGAGGGSGGSPAVGQAAQQAQQAAASSTQAANHGFQAASDFAGALKKWHRNRVVR